MKPKLKFYVEVFYSTGEPFDFGPAWGESESDIRARIKPRGTVSKITVAPSAANHAELSSNAWWDVCPKIGEMINTKREPRPP